MLRALRTSLEPYLTGSSRWKMAKMAIIKYAGEVFFNLSGEREKKMPKLLGKSKPEPRSEIRQKMAGCFKGERDKVI